MRFSLIVLMALPVFAAAQTPLSLDEAVRRAREASPTVAAARAEVEAARHATRGARARRSPQLFANGFAFSSKPGATVATPGGMNSAIMALPMGETAVANLMLMVPLFTGGTLQAQVAAASASERVALGELAEMTGEAALMAEEAYLMALLAAEEVLREESRVRAADEMVRTTQARFEAGKEIQAAVQRAEAERAMARRELTMAQNERSKALLELQAAMNADMAQAVTVGDRLEVRAPEGSLDEFVSRSRENRGRVVAARARRDAARQEVRAAEGMLRPQVYAQAMADASNDPMMRGGSVGLTMSLPLFDAGERRADVRRMRAMQARAEALVRTEEIAAEKEVRQRWLDLETARANAESAQASVEAAQTAYDVMRLRVEAGKGILLEQLDALQTLNQARADLARAIYEQRLALARLYRAAGVSTVGGQP